MIIKIRKVSFFQSTLSKPGRYFKSFYKIPSNEENISKELAIKRMSSGDYHLSTV